MIKLILYLKFGCLFNKFVLFFGFFGVVYCILESIPFFFLLAFDLVNAEITQ